MGLYKNPIYPIHQQAIYFAPVDDKLTKLV